jgi:hypothetical protein
VGAITWWLLEEHWLRAHLLFMAVGASSGANICDTLEVLLGRLEFEP